MNIYINTYAPAKKEEIRIYWEDSKGNEHLDYSGENVRTFDEIIFKVICEGGAWYVVRR